jgi:hypothetical protein
MICFFFRYSCTGILKETRNPASSWLSDSSMSCKAPAAIHASHRLSLTFGIVLGTNSAVLSYDAPDLISMLGANHPTSGGSVLTVTGSDFGVQRYSVQSRIGRSGAQGTIWFSASSVSCRSSSGIGSGFRVSLTVGNSHGTKLAAVTYNLPSVSSCISQNREISGTWCAYPGETCYCQGIVSFVGADGLLSTSLSDSTSSLTCSGASTAMCYCFNRPFTGGQSVTVIGLDFGVDDQSPTASISLSSAEFTRWLSQSSLICKLPSCTDCGVTSSLQSVIVAVAGLESTYQTVTVPYNYINGTSARRLLEGTMHFHTPYSYRVQERFKCPYFWQETGLVVLNMEAGMICRFAYSAGEKMTWILDPCAGLKLCYETIIQIDNETVALIQLSLVFTSFSTGKDDKVTVSSCSSASCELYWTKLSGFSGVELPSASNGSPCLRIDWETHTLTNTSLGWAAVWNSSHSRKFKKILSPKTRQEAVAICNSLVDEESVWHLASVNSQEEQNAALQLASQADVWIGLGYLVEEDTFYWPDGSLYQPKPYTNWAIGEPDKLAKNGSGITNCTLLGGSQQGFWRRENCLTELPFICSRK